MTKEEAKATVKEKLMEKKNGIKSWVSDHKKSLIKGGVIAGAIAAVGGTVAAVVNRCGLPSDCGSYEEYDVLEVDFDSSDDSEECDICEESEEIKDE